MANYDLILASGSPRRRDFLAKLGLNFWVCKPDIDESVLAGESPRVYVERMASSKAQLIASEHTTELVLAADTIVVCEGQILGKPQDRDDAKRILRLLSNKTHEVMTAVSIRYGEKHRELFAATKVTFAKLDEELIETYVASGESDDKSGAYAVQGVGAMFISKVEGSVSGVVGLPVSQVREALIDFGIKPRIVDASKWA